jgi:hypothetical protein
MKVKLLETKEVDYRSLLKSNSSKYSLQQDRVALLANQLLEKEQEMALSNSPNKSRDLRTLRDQLVARDCKITFLKKRLSAETEKDYLTESLIMDEEEKEEEEEEEEFL